MASSQESGNRPRARNAAHAGQAFVLGLAVLLAAVTGCVRNINRRSPEVLREAAAYYYENGSVAMKRGDYAQALVDFTEAIRIDPDYAPPHWDRGRIYISTPGMEEHGWRDIERARELPLPGRGFPDYRRVEPEPIPEAEGEALASMLTPVPLPEGAAEISPELPPSPTARGDGPQPNGDSQSQPDNESDSDGGPDSDGDDSDDDDVDDW